MSAELTAAARTPDDAPLRAQARSLAGGAAFSPLVETWCARSVVVSGISRARRSIPRVPWENDLPSSGALTTGELVGADGSTVVAVYNLGSEAGDIAVGLAGLGLDLAARSDLGSVGGSWTAADVSVDGSRIVLVAGG